MKLLADVINGRLRPCDPADWAVQFAILKPGRYVVTIEAERKAKTLRQLAWWRAGIVPIVAAYEAQQHGRTLPYPTDAMHDLLLRIFWPCEETSLGPIRAQTRNFSTVQMAQLCDKVRSHYATADPPLFIPSPDEAPIDLEGT
jgi:hypothetical protein